MSFVVRNGRRAFGTWAFVVGVVALAAPLHADSATLDFGRDIRPILSDKCFACHGPDEATREADLRLDRREGIYAESASGATPVVPGDPEASELIRRITSDDPSEQMPPADSTRQLTPDEREKLVAWVAAGAEFKQHWSFVAPARPDVPAAADAGWPRNPIDNFVRARMQDAGLPPSPEASRETLVRRLYLDLLGLPPTLEQIDAFVNDSSPDAYERLVDDLLASAHYGERMAMEWLDAARFADTNGYHLDNGRDMSRWRAWVIDAFNQNLPFDEFTIDQIAGDLLPNATPEQRIASGFNRNHMINFEGGAIPEEYHAAYIVDRVSTTSTVWLGLTVACAQCHDHKFDPISQREFYQLYAFFHNVPEKGLDGNQGNAAPMLPLPTPEQAATQRILETQIEALQQLSSEAAEDKVLKEATAGELKKLEEERTTVVREIPTTMVMSEMAEPRETFVMVRGQYDQFGTKVQADTPASLPPLPADAPRNRLGLARWLVAPEQPLTSRVIANRYWQLMFGTGLVTTAEDFGSQGEQPSHPELLDWLACELQQSTQPGVAGTPQERWNVKAFIKLLVMSATYRQQSAMTQEGLERDPQNRWLARAPRFRLPAEAIRDQALAVSGLLKHRIGGASVSPYQPGDLWGELSSREDSANWTAQFFVQSHGDDLYRRSMYTFWKRTCPPVQLSTFDAPDRETCVVRRARTNTPLQALILLNDPTYLEASRKLAERILREAPADLDGRLHFLFRTVTSRAPTETETAILSRIWEQQRLHYEQHPHKIDALLSIGESPTDEKLDRLELASWTMLASAVLNLDETVTRN
jgi:mono/diheme cytochrome c family protein